MKLRVLFFLPFLLFSSVMFAENDLIASLNLVVSNKRCKKDEPRRFGRVRACSVVTPTKTSSKEHIINNFNMLVQAVKKANEKRALTEKSLAQKAILDQVKWANSLRKTVEKREKFEFNDYYDGGIFFVKRPCS